MIFNYHGLVMQNDREIVESNPSISSWVAETKESFMGIMWHEGTAKVKGKFLSNNDNTCDIVRDKILGD